MEVNVYTPHLALQPFVLNISTIKVMLPEGLPEVVTPYPPTPFQSMLFYCNDPVSMSGMDEENFIKQPFSVVLGPQFSRVNIKVHRQLRAIRVDFVPGGMYRIFGIPMHELFDKGFDAQDLLGSEIRILNEELQNIGDLSEGKNLVEKFLMHRLNRIKSVLPFDSAMRILLHHHGKLSVEGTASLSCMSIKQFERTCKERIGMNPKLYSRILKFSKAYRLRENFPEMSWTAIGYEAGYYDQMHLIRDFKVFAGVNPSVIARQLLETPIRMQKDLPI
ncbi:MAG: helix-turn-helix transcriptional regulator [Flavobacteriia bacterium]|nr:helix-turn-helix transcriptional regulator [Flavobacteriia bacterium]MBH2023956.1 helix-turn-helix transcriptional regulator [Flavobacteriales bacterium]